MEGNPGFRSDDQRLSIAVSHAAHFIDEAVEILFFNCVFYCLKDFKCASRSAASGGPYQNQRRWVIPDFLPAGLRLHLYFVELQLFSFSSFSFWS